MVPWSFSVSRQGEILSWAMLCVEESRESWVPHFLLGLLLAFAAFEIVAAYRTEGIDVYPWIVYCLGVPIAEVREREVTVS